MKITDVEAIWLQLPVVDERCDGTQDTLIVRVHTDAGIIGVGEVDSSPMVAKAIIEAPLSHAIARGLRQCVLGQNPLDIAVLWERMYQGTIFFGRGGAAQQAISGVDMALWDILGKVLGQPVYQLLGGAFHTKLRAYASNLFGETPQATYEQARRLAYEYQDIFGKAPREITMVRGCYDSDNEKQVYEAGAKNVCIPNW